MTTADIIKQNRIRLNMSQAELGKILGVNKAAVQKWESGKVKNLKAETINVLANLFQISASDLLCLEKYNEKELSEEVKLIEAIKFKYGKEAVCLLENFVVLNKAGKKKIIEQAEDLAAMSKYVQDVQDK